VVVWHDDCVVTTAAAAAAHGQIPRGEGEGGADPTERTSCKHRTSDQ